MSYLLKGADPVLDRPSGVYGDADLNQADLDLITGLSVTKDTTGLSRLSGSTQIRYLAISVWTNETAEFARSLPNLEHLYIYGVRGPLVGIGNLPKLKILLIYACPGLINLMPFEGSSGIETLWISGCIQLEDLEGIDRFDKLLEFEIQGAMTKTGRISTLAPLSRCKALRYVALATRITNKDLSPLHNLRELEYLWLQNRFSQDQYKAILASCPLLEEIDLHDGVFDRSVGLKKDEDDN